MANLFRLGLRFTRKTTCLPSQLRNISTSPCLGVKEIKQTTVGKSLVIEGVIVPSERKEFLVKVDNTPTKDAKQQPCYMCALGLDVKHTDVLILSQFVRSDGCMLPKRITGLCSRQQKKIGKMVTMAQKAGLMINLTPAWCKKDPTKRFAWKAFNTYYDESTIFQKKPPKWGDRYKY